MVNKNRLLSKLKNYNIFLSADKIDLIERYVAMLLEWNEKINLTSITIPEDIENKHIIDCLCLAVNDILKGRILDVGSGAGFPGIICSIYRGNIDITLMEPTGKRAMFLEEVRNELHLSYTVKKERAEEAARKGEREKYDVVTARAVAALPQLAEYCLPLVKAGGMFVAMKGKVEEELKAAGRAIVEMGGEIVEKQEYMLPDGSERSLIYVKKIKSTPSKYPRQAARIKRMPL